MYNELCQKYEICTYTQYMYIYIYHIYLYMYIYGHPDAVSLMSEPGDTADRPPGEPRGLQIQVTRHVTYPSGGVLFCCHLRRHLRGRWGPDTDNPSLCKTEAGAWDTPAASPTVSGGRG